MSIAASAFPQELSGTYIRAILQAYLPRTVIYAVQTLEGVSLGTMQWYGSWRRYAFVPAARTVYEATCLKEIAAWCEQLTALQRQRAKATTHG